MADDLVKTMEDIARTRVPEVDLLSPIEGYELLLVKRAPDTHIQCAAIPLRLGRMGGAQIKGVADLITLIEDAVFKQEKKDE